MSQISRCYDLREIEVTPDQLLLDPNNPRIVLDVDSHRKFSTQELASQNVQEYILSVINKDDYHVAELIKGIRASGFLPGLSDMIVKHVRDRRYLVLEGNRRTTAIKHLLTLNGKLGATVRATLERIAVKEFIFKPNNGFSEEEVTDILLGTIHITGPLGWGALERAHYIYKSYVRALRKLYPHVSGFEYTVECSREVAELFNLSTKAVRKLIAVYRVYQQLKDKGYSVEPHHFTLIDLAVGDRSLSESYFCLSGDTFQFSNQGLNRFNQLCITEDKPINNPRDFRDFSTIFKNGTEYELSQVENKEQSVQQIFDRVNERLGQKEFLNRLQQIKSQLQDLHPADFRGVNAEIDTIRQIKQLVDDKLTRLVSRR